MIKTPPKKIRVVYLGNLLAMIRALSEESHLELTACFLEPADERQEILLLAKKKRFPIFSVSSPEEIQKALETLGAIDLGIVTNFGIILSKENLNLPRNGFVNLHLGLLPENPGRTPIQNALVKKMRVTGITLHRMTEAVDQGPIVDKRIIAIRAGMTRDEIFERLEHLAANLLLKNLPFLL